MAGTGFPALDVFVQPMIGLPCWGARNTYGSFLTFDFGQPRLIVREPRTRRVRDVYVEGEWHLWIYCCHWRAYEDDVEIAWSEDDRKLMDRAAVRLNGQALVAIRVEPETGRSRFAFDLGGALETWPYGEDPTDEQWSISTPADTFQWRADGRYNCAPGNTPPAELQWLPAR